MLASTSVDTVELVLKLAFLVLLYLFIWRIVRSASRDVSLPQESFIMAASDAAAAGLGRGTPELTTGALVVVKSPVYEEGERFELDTAPLTVGRGAPNDVQLDGDEFASAKHARIEPRRDGVWVEDIGSTNGTYVNGAHIDRPRKLAPNDVVRVGETDLRYER
jgi:pSer/pThr/pTyr-binding forkhead associated (FHA) protein